MAELLSPDRMRQIARPIDWSDLHARRPGPAPAIVWSVDATTGRPTEMWVMLTEREKPAR